MDNNHLKGIVEAGNNDRVMKYDQAGADVDNLNLIASVDADCRIEFSSCLGQEA